LEHLEEFLKAIAAGLSIFAPLKLQGNFWYVLYLILVSANEYDVKIENIKTRKIYRDSFFIKPSLTFFLIKSSFELLWDSFK
jgi:hypothetical protein